MATPTSTFVTYDAIGNREDLSDVIYNVDPTDTPFVSSIPRVRATAITHEWQADTLAAASNSNAVLEGDDATTDAVSATTRLANIAQISDKVPRVTGSQQAVVSAGRNDELAYQIVKMSLELKRDIESVVLRNGARVAGDTTVARQTGGAEVWLTSNTSHGAGGSAGSLTSGQPATARTDGTNRDFTESLLKSQLVSIWNNGGDPDCIMVAGFNKQVVSGFTGNATRFKQAEDSKLMASIDIYQSDFGDLEIIPNRFMVAESCLILQKDLWAVAELRPMRMTNLAKTGDSERRQILSEYALESRNQQGSGAVFDLNTS